MNTSNKIILLVEDQETDRRLIKDALKTLNIPNKLVITENGEQALEYLRSTEDSIFLVLCDINMPRMNGKELKEKIEKDEFMRYKSVPFIYLTTSSAQNDIIGAYDLKAQAFFSKPDTFAETVTLVSSIVSYWSMASVPAK